MPTARTLPRRTTRAADRTRCTGAAAVEFALVLGILMLIVAGTVEIGRALWYYDALAKGTRDAARYLSTVPAADLAARLAQADDIVAAAAETANIPNWATVVVSPRCDAPAAASCAGVAASDVSTVTVSASYALDVGAWIPFVPAGGREDRFWAVTLQPRTTMPYMW